MKQTMREIQGVQQSQAAALSRHQDEEETDKTKQAPIEQMYETTHKIQIALFVLRFYGPVNPMGSCRARSVYLTTRLLGRLSPLRG